MKKYYDLVVSLIKSHKKFNNCEGILDDIVNDVYAHTEAILNTVKDEKVITSYLNKIVSISMITVPKRLGVNTKRETIIEDVSKQIESVSNADDNIFIDNSKSEQESQTDSGSERHIEESDVDTDYMTLSENEISEYGDVIKNETMSDEIETLELSTEFDTNDDIIEISNDNKDIDVDDRQVNTDNFLEDIVDEINQKDISFNKSLVDKMINSSFEFENDSDELIQTDELEPTEVIDDELIQTDELEPTEVIDDELIQTDELEPTEVIDDELLLIDEDSIIEDLSEDIDNIQLDNSSDIDNSVVSEIEPNNFSNPYTCFDYTPEKIEIDEKEILSELDKLESKNPEKQIKKICELKYKKCLSISDIAKELNMPVESVLEGLNEIIYAVKD